MIDVSSRPHVKTRYLFVTTFVGVVIGWAITTNWQGGEDAFRRSWPGFVIRRVRGEVGIQQDVNDLVAEVTRPGTVAALRSWAAAVVVAQRGKEFGAGEVWNGGDLRLVQAPEIAPPLSLAQFHAVVGGANARGISPEYYLLVDSSGRAVGVALSWANFRVGLAVVPGDQVPALSDVYDQRHPAPDLCVFAR